MKIMMVQNKSELIGIIYLIITILLFSTFEVTSKLISIYMSSTQITFVRFFIGGIVLLPFTIYRIIIKKIHLGVKSFLSFLLLGVVNIVISMGLVQLGLIYTNASVSAVIFSINPLFVVIFARFLLNENMTKNKIFGICLGVVGVIILFIGRLTDQKMSLIGMLLVLCASICFAFYTVIGKRIINYKYDSLITNTFSFLLGSICLIPIQLFIHVPIIPEISLIIPQVLYMSIFVTGIAYVLYFEGLSRLDTGAGSMMYFAKPAVASLLAVIILHEHISAILLIGMVVIAIGIFVAQQRKKIA